MPTVGLPLLQGSIQAGFVHKQMDMCAGHRGTGDSPLVKRSPETKEMKLYFIQSVCGVSLPDCLSVDGHCP